MAKWQNNFGFLVFAGIFFTITTLLPADVFATSSSDMSLSLSRMITPSKLDSFRNYIRQDTHVHTADTKPLEIGDELEFYLSDDDNQFYKTPATLKAIGKHCYIFVENSQDERVTDKHIEMYVDAFDNRIYPIVTSYFGKQRIPGIDGDSRISILLCDIQDGYNPPENRGYVRGYYHAVNSMPKAIFPTSNERELIVIDTYPTPPLPFGTIAHELQHLIHWHNNPEQETWVDEGMAQLAEIFTHGKVDRRGFVRNPERENLLGWNPGQENYGQVFYFFFYILQQYANYEQAARTFTQSILNSNQKGIDSVLTALKAIDTDITFNQLFLNFSLACFLNDPTINDGLYSFKGRNILKYEPFNGRLRSIDGTPIMASRFERSAPAWSTGAIKYDIEGIGGQIKVSFDGITQGTANMKNSFEVAVVLKDHDTTFDKTSSQIHWLEFNDNKAEEFIPFDAGTHNTLKVLWCNLGPDSVHSRIDFLYARRAAPASFTLTVAVNTDEVVKQTDSQVADQSINSGNIHSYLGQLLEFKSQRRPFNRRERQRMQASIQNGEDMIHAAVRRSLVRGDTQTAANFIQFYKSIDRRSRNNLDDLKNRIAESIRFEAAQTGNPALISELADFFTR